ncbi:hypothetical protein GCM10010168_28300 [Actinoplanes ianthinogenes]|uniref:Lipoprotein n=1 Tax=Actinoplanes ianthinogenes TaxID=122358 RepID=A0ABM7LL29_9ACTN|nr:hypothetical protein [Actinoplanes ianthinogenes]BCJ39971.1 hypothetical protein Aiant_06280 [Actinoplanes ianthinogenes]GGR09373.1 hypothetical protein GCM10010168_28300 [Actinoplanes ianthinogenes]
MSRRLALIPILFLLPLAGCTGKSGSGTAAPPAAATTATPATSAAPVSNSKKPTSTSSSAAPNKAGANKAKQSGSGDPAFGDQYAFLRSGKASTRQVTYDLVEWYEGKEAVKACAEDGETGTENDHCTGWYIRNHNTKLRTLTVDPDALIGMMGDGEMKKVDLKTFLSDVPPDSVISFRIDANRIVRLEQIYLP